MQRNRKLRRWIDFSVIMQHIFDFVCSIIIICLIFEHYIILHSGVPYHCSQAFKASDILCLLTNSGSSELEPSFTSL